MSASRARAFLEQHGLAAHRDRGQNFLHDERQAERLVTLAGVTPEEGVIEIGTGLGMLTRVLAAHARRVETIEIDAGLVRALEATGLPANVRLHHADALELGPRRPAARARRAGPGRGQPAVLRGHPAAAPLPRAGHAACAASP